MAGMECDRLVSDDSFLSGEDLMSRGDHSPPPQSLTGQCLVTSELTSSSSLIRSREGWLDTVPASRSCGQMDHSTGLRGSPARIVFIIFFTSAHGHSTSTSILPGANSCLVWRRLSTKPPKGSAATCARLCACGRRTSGYTIKYIADKAAHQSSEDCKAWINHQP